MLSELLSKIDRNYEAYALGDFDFAEVMKIQTNGLLTCKLLQRAGRYEDCLILGEFYFPKDGDQGVLFFVGKQKYPCFYAFNQTSGILSGETGLSSFTDNIKVNFTNLSEDFLKRIRQVAVNVGVKYSWLLIMLYFESGFDPTAVSPTGATGIMQWTEVRANEDGTTKAQLLQMTALQQLDYVEIDFLRAKGRLKNLQDVCMYVFLPVMVGKGADDKFPSSQDGMTTPKEYVSRAITKAKNAGYAVDETGEIKLNKDGSIELKSNQDTDK